MATNKSSNRAREISIALGSISPFVFVTLYIVTIVAFWGVFLLLPRGSFYHSTAQYEREFLNQDANSILNAIKEEILDNLRVHYPNLAVSENSWVVDRSELRVNSLNVSDYPDSISFQVSAPLWYIPADKKFIQSSLQSVVRLGLNKETFIADRAYYFPHLEDTSTVKIEGVPDAPGVAILFPSRTPSITGPNISLPLSLRNQMLEFGEAYRGFPTNVSGNEIRMLYLSVGIATSTALGDITPITTMSRSLILFESVISILITSLFLNSLANVIVYKGTAGKKLRAQNNQDFLTDLLSQPIKTEITAIPHK
jgi:hypothetical protein